MEIRNELENFFAWSVSSAIEQEPQSVAMGLVFFSVPGLLLMLLGYRLSARKKAS